MEHHSEECGSAEQELTSANLVEEKSEEYTFGRAYPSWMCLGTRGMLSHIFIKKQDGESLKEEMVRDI